MACPLHGRVSDWYGSEPSTTLRVNDGEIVQSGGRQVSLSWYSVTRRTHEQQLATRRPRATTTETIR